jgi:hypothetical protein
MENQRNIELIKLSGLNGSTITDGATTDAVVVRVMNEPISTVKEMESFNSELEDYNKYKNVVSEFIPVTVYYISY